MELTEGDCLEGSAHTPIYKPHILPLKEVINIINAICLNKGLPSKWCDKIRSFFICSLINKANWNCYLTCIKFAILFKNLQYAIFSELSQLPLNTHLMVVTEVASFVGNPVLGSETNTVEYTRFK